MTMEGSNSRAKHRLTITIDAVDLPVAEDARQTVLDEIGEHVSNHLSEQSGLDIMDAEMTVATGYWYATVPADCPHCGTEVDLRSIHLDDTNGAFANAVCHNENCGWSGDAVYRLIDLEESQGDTFESSVLTGDITPSYHPY